MEEQVIEKSAIGSDDEETVFIIKTGANERLIFGVVYPPGSPDDPDSIDTQGDYATAEEVEKAEQRFMIKAFKTGKLAKAIDRDHDHRGPYGYPVEVFILRKDLLQKMIDKFPDGSWIAGTLVTDKETIKKIDSGASMEPRSLERGNEFSRYSFSSLLSASMEPRSLERGNQVSSTPTPATVSSFNGATFTRTWKRVFSLLFLKFIERFNGATFTRTWKRFSAARSSAPSRCFNGATFTRTWKR